MSTTPHMPTCAPRAPEAAGTNSPARTIVLGLGNPILTDDSVGLRVVEQLKTALNDLPGVELAEDYCGGLRLMERLVGFDRAVVIDARRSAAPPGTIRVLEPGAVSTRHGDSAHDVSLQSALELGRRVGAALPADDNVRIVAIEVSEVEEFGEACTPAVAAAVPRAAGLVCALLVDWR
ncbi:MAG: hydrogenase maturation protease [Phycisphaerales bacterium]|nr:hydrogenase maturation protease [Phycisphaerales bacterium]